MNLMNPHFAGVPEGEWTATAVTGGETSDAKLAAAQDLELATANREWLLQTLAEMGGHQPFNEPSRNQAHTNEVWKLIWGKNPTNFSRTALSAASPDPALWLVPSATVMARGRWYFNQLLQATATVPPVDVDPQAYVLQYPWLEHAEALARLAAAASPEDPGRPELSHTWYANRSGNVRSGPGLANHIVGSITPGQQVNITFPYEAHIVTEADGITTYAWVPVDFASDRGGWIAWFLLDPEPPAHLPKWHDRKHPEIDRDLVEAARAEGVTDILPLLQAICIAESGDNGITQPGQPLSRRFEAALFRQRTGQDRLPVQFTEEMLQCTSMGVAHIMGFNAVSVGYAGAGAMYDTFRERPGSEYQALVRFVVARPALLSALRSRSWNEIKELYNGRQPNAWLDHFRAGLATVPTPTQPVQYKPQVTPMYAADPKPKSMPIVRRIETALEVGNNEHQVKAAVKGLTSTGIKTTAGLIGLGSLSELAALLIPQIEQGLFTILIGLLTASAVATADPSGIHLPDPVPMGQTGEVAPAPLPAQVPVPAPPPVPAPVPAPAPEPPPAPAPVPAPLSVAVPAPATLRMFTVAVPLANIRSQPRLDALVVGQIRAGTEVLSVDTDGMWHQIRDNYWLHDSVLQAIPAQG